MDGSPEKQPLPVGDKSQESQAKVLVSGSDLIEATALCSLEKVTQLIRAGTATARDREMAFIFAASLGHAGILRFLLLEGTSPNSTDENGFRALHGAAMNGHEQSVHILLENGAEVNVAESVEKETPLHLSAFNGHLPVAALLLQNGAMADARDQRGYSPLHHASVNGHFPLASLLVGGGARADLQCRRGRTPLHAASLGGFEDIVNLLHQHGATPDIQDTFGDTALHCAAREGHPAVVASLLDSGHQLQIANRYSEEDTAI